MAASASDVRAGGSFYELYARDNLTGVLSRAKAGAMAFASAMGRVGQTVGRVGAAIGGAGAAGVAAFKPAFDAIGESGRLADTADAFGLTAEKASRLFGIMQSGGSDLRDATEGVVTFNQRIADALAGTGEEASQLFRDLGKSADSFFGDSADKFFGLIDALRAVPDPAKRVQLLLKAVGEDTGKHLIPLLSMSADQVRELGDAFQQSGADLQASREATRAYAAATAQIGRVWREVAAAIAPALTTAATLVQRAVKPVVEWVRENKALVAVGLAVAGAMVATGAALVAVGLAAGVVSAAVGGLVTVATFAMKAVAAVGAVIFSPFTLAAAAVVGVTYAFLRYTDAGKQATAWALAQAGALRDRLRPALDRTRAAFGAFANAVQKGDVGAALEVAGAAAEAAWYGTLNRAGKAWDDFVRPIQDAGDDLFGWIGPVARGIRADLERVWEAATEAFDRLVAKAREAWTYVTNLWDRFGPRVMAALEPVKELLAGLFAPVVFAVAAVREAWDGLDRNVLITVTRLARTVEEVWIKLTGNIENLLRKLASAAVGAVGQAVALFGAIPGGPDVSKAVAQLEALKEQIGKEINVDLKVRLNREAYDQVEAIFREQAEQAKRVRAITDGFAAMRRSLRAEASDLKLGGAIDNANRFDFAGAAGAIAGGLGSPFPNGAPVVPNASVRGAAASDVLGQQLGTGRTRDTERLVGAIEKNNPRAIADALAPVLAALFRVGG